MTKEAIVYARVSSPSQMTGHGLQRQLDGCLSYAKKNGYCVVAVFSEIRSSTQEYVARKQAVTMAKRRKCVILCEDVDRWTRKGASDLGDIDNVIFVGVSGNGDVWSSAVWEACAKYIEEVNKIGVQK